MTSSSRLIDSVANTTAHKDRDDLESAIARLLLQYLSADSVVIHRLLDDNGVLRVARRVEMNAATENPREFAAQIDLSTLPALRDVRAWSDCFDRREHVQYVDVDGVRHSVFAIENEHGINGLLEVASSQGLQARDAELVSGILRIMKNHVALLDYGQRDTLTGLFNRKVFETTFEKLRARLQHEAASQRARQCSNTSNLEAEPSWLGMIDIDNFKTINDTHGHLFGDEILLLVAQVMQKSFRGADLLFRFGGEEFVVVLERASPSGAAVAFERLRVAIESFNFPQIGRVTLSLGYTEIESCDAPATCVERADAALYYAKNHGRNSVCCYELLVASGKLKPKPPAGEDIELF